MRPTPFSNTQHSSGDLYDMIANYTTAQESQQTSEPSSASVLSRNRSLLNSVAHNLTPDQVNHQINNTPRRQASQPSTQLGQSTTFSVSDLRSTMQNIGYPCTSRILDSTIASRIQFLNVSIATLMEIIAIAKNRDHPLLQGPESPEYYASRILAPIAQIFHTHNMKRNYFMAFSNGNNNSHQIINSVLDISPED